MAKTSEVKTSARKQYARLITEAQALERDLALEAVELGDYEMVQATRNDDGTWEVVIRHKMRSGHEWQFGEDRSTPLVNSSDPAEVLAAITDVLMRLGGLSSKSFRADIRLSDGRLRIEFSRLNFVNDDGTDRRGPIA